ncbi:hypothetical protein RDABS01_023405 [Bienertia sinuspersici]
MGEADGDIKPSEIQLSTIPIWARIYVLPFKGRGNETNAQNVTKQEEESNTCARRLFVTRPNTTLMEVREDVNEVVQNLNEVHITRGEQINHGSTCETHFNFTAETSRDATTWNKSTRTWKRLNKRNGGEHYECCNILGSKSPNDEDITHLDVVKKKCGFSNGVCLSSNGRSGGMGFWWNELNVQTKSFSEHHFEADILNSTMVINLPIQNSDHGPVLLKEDQQRTRGSKLKKFESYWLSDVNCEEVVKESWVKNGNCTTPVRITRVLNNLSGWAKDTFGDIKKRLKQVERRLISLQGHEPDAVNLELYFEHGGWDVEKSTKFSWSRKGVVFLVFLFLYDGQVINYIEGESLLENNLEHGGPPKLKHFLWRACHGMLAVMERLFYRHISPSKACRICGCDSETVLHSIFWCKYATYVWSNSTFYTLVNNGPASSLVYSHRPIVPSNLSANAWSRPPEGWVKINVDAHLGEDGTIILAVVQKIKAGWDVDMAEAYAARLEYKLPAGSNGRTPIFLFFDDIQNFINLLEAFICVHVKRGGNFLAHLIAREHVEVGIGTCVV